MTVARTRTRTRAIVPLAVLGAWIVLALVVPWLPLDARSVRTQGALEVLRAPGGSHVLGTDEIGRDVLAALVLGARASLGLVGAAALLALALGVPLGVLAARPRALGGGVRIGLDAALALPALAWAAAARGLVGEAGGVLGLALVLGLAQAPAVARLIAGELARLDAAPFVEATRAAGAGPLDLARALWPHVAPTLAVAAASVAAGTVLAEAALGFLGLGLGGQTPSWGELVRQAHAHGLPWWLAVPPVVALLGVALALQALADAWSRRQAPRMA